MEFVIEIYPMKKFVEGDSNVADYEDEVTHWDILVRDQEGGDYIEEFEDLNWVSLNETVSLLERRYPDAPVDWYLVDNLLVRPE